MKYATLSITHLLNDGSHAPRQVRGIDAARWDDAVMQARDIVRAQHRDNGPVVAATLSTFNADPLGPTLNKSYQPNEWV